MSNRVENYGWNDSDGPHSCDYIAPMVLKLLNDHSGIKRVCDVGRRNGALAGYLQREGYSVSGVEYDENGCRIAKQSYLNINFYNLGVADDPEEVRRHSGEFDAVVSTEVVEHLFSPHLLPQFARGLLRANGLLIVTTPYHGYWKNLALAVMGKWDHHHTALWHGGHIKFFSRATLTTLLEQNGFRVIGFHGTGRMPWLWKSMILVAKAV